MRRKLDKKELALTIKSLDRVKEELVYNQYQKDICDLKIDRGLKVEYDKQMRDYKILKREYCEKIKQLELQKHIAEDQIRNGVEVKKNSGEKREEEKREEREEEKILNKKEEQDG